MHEPEGERTPGGILGGSVGFLISKLGFYSSMRFAEALEPLDIQPSHFALLRFVSVAEGQSQQALGEALKIPPSRIVALVDEVEERGLVERRQNPQDRRANALHLTAKGRRLLERAMEIATAYEDALFASLNDDERAQLLELLRRVAADQDLPIGVHPGLATARPPV
jgi:DNA-binding MarR family transcriptional regulator